MNDDDEAEDEQPVAVVVAGTHPRISSTSPSATSFLAGLPATPASRSSVSSRSALIIVGSTDLYEGTWTLALEPIGDDATHLVTRYRADYEFGARMAVVRPVMTPLHAFMERKQLRTIKQRAEAAV